MLYLWVFFPVFIAGIVLLLLRSYRCVSTDVGEVHDPVDALVMWYQGIILDDAAELGVNL
jgi:hypothetical protein